jgi:hypothetical protein
MQTQNTAKDDSLAVFVFFCFYTFDFLLHKHQGVYDAFKIFLSAA